jgi:hypothetical protein
MSKSPPRADAKAKPRAREAKPINKVAIILSSPVTEASIREVMIAAGVTPPKVIIAKTQQIY